MRTFPPILTLAILLTANLSLTAEEAPSFSKQVRPLLAKYCVECHPGENPDGMLSLDTYKGLMAGGEHGKAVIPGNPDMSRLIRSIEGKGNPKMPPPRSPQPTKEEIALIRAWVAAGAKEDASTEQMQLPRIPPRHQAAPAVAALAYDPQGKVLAAARHRDVVFIDVPSGDVLRQLPPQEGRVTALAYNQTGTLLAIAAGETGSSGKIVLMPADKKASTQPIVLAGHTDVIHGLAFSPDGKTLASCGYDRLVKLWDVAAGTLIRDLKDHSDSVYGLCFNSDGQLLASAGADRAVKVWDVASGTRLFTLGESTDWAHAVAWSPDGKHLAAAGVDRSIRVWQVSRETGNLIHSVFAHEGPVTALAYSPDGKTLYSMSEDRRLKAWDAGRMIERHLYELQSDTPLSLAIRPDGKQLALGRFDGALVLLDEKTGESQGQPLPAKRPVLEEIEPNDSPRTGQAVPLPVTISGSLDRAGEVDFFALTRRQASS